MSFTIHFVGISCDCTVSYTAQTNWRHGLLKILRNKLGKFM